MSVRATLTTRIPPWLVTIIQGAATVAVGEGVTELVHVEAGLPGNYLVYLVAASTLYATGVKALERKFPSWAWLLMLLPSSLPTD